MAVRLAAFSLRCNGVRCAFNFLRPPLTAHGVSSPQIDSQALAISSYSTQVAQPGKAAKHWKYERAVALGLLGLIPAGMVYPCAVVDYGLAVLIPIHGHWGFQSVVEDYFPQATKMFGRVLVYIMSFGAFSGLMYLNMKDVGICNAVKMVWSL